MTDPSSNHDGANLVVIWIAVFLGKLGIHQWSDAAALFAALYSLMLIGKFCWTHWRDRNKP